MSDTTSISNSCPKCGAALPSAATAGLCPRCLMAEAMAPTQTDSQPSSRPPLPAEEIAPHFPQLEILECLGRGGMGVVYKARQKSLNRIVALKLLAPERVNDPQFAERFAREAQALAALNHPNIVTIHDFGQAGGFYYLLMEFVDGVNLRQLLRARKFTPEEALAIVPPLCDALQFAHERGIVHRDIKPENLLLDKDGRVKVADFGIAKMLGTINASGGAGESAAPESATQTTVGTPAYSAPEQKTDPRRVDSRADIYSLGVVFYELLTGELPGKRIELPSAKVHLDVRLDEVVLRALEREPERRYQTAGELKTVIETVVAETLKAASAGCSAPGTDPNIESRETSALPASCWSRAAIAGAVGIGCFLVVMILWLVGCPASSYPSFGRTLPQILFGGVILPAGMVAGLVGTMLGWIAVVQIRRSAGRLRGLKWAAFEGLFLPLLTVDLFILLAWVIAVKALAASRGLGGSMFRNLWDFAAFTLLLGLAIGLVNYLIIRPVWRAISGSAGSAPSSTAPTQRSLRWLAVAFGLAVVILYPAYIMWDENSRKAHYGWGVEGGAELNYQVFEADAAQVDQQVPFSVREPGNALATAGTYTLTPTYTAAAQMAEIDDAILGVWQQAAATGSGSLVNKTKKGENIYQWSQDSWSYHTGQASGKGQGFCGMGRDLRSLRFRIRYQVSHIIESNARHPVTAEISYDGPAPTSGKARAFFIPFGRDQQAKYLVIAFAAKADSEGAAMPPAPPAGFANGRVIVEGTGWGGFHVGATREELVTALGQPDGDSDNHWMKWKRDHVHCLVDDSQGAFELRFDEGFTGLTAAGIGIGSALKDALAAYGEPSSQEIHGSAKKLLWNSKGILIWFHDDRAAQIVVFQKIEPVELKLKWPPVGQRIVLNVERKRNGEYFTPPQPDPLKESATLEKKYGLTVLQATPEGGHEVELEFLSIRDRTILGGKTKLDYDSTLKTSAPSTNSLADLYGKVVGSKIRIFLNARNEVERMEGVDELERRLAGAPASAFSKLQFGGDNLKQMMNGLHDYLPTKAVQPGDTWPFQEAMAIPSLGTVNLDFTVTFRAWEQHGKRNCARLEFQSTLTTQPYSNSDPGRISVSSFLGTLSGVVWFDPELGMIMEAAGNNDLTMVLNNLPTHPAENPGATSQGSTIYRFHDVANETVLEK